MPDRWGMLQLAHHSGWNVGLRFSSKWNAMRVTPVVLALLVSAAFSQTRSRLAEYALILTDPPVAAQISSRSELRGAAARGRLSRVVSAQAAVKAELARRKTPALGATFSRSIMHNFVPMAGFGFRF